MPSAHDLLDHLRHWSTLLGEDPMLGPERAGRALWPVTAADGRRYVLKRVGPWRNLPLADQARVLSHLAASGIAVAPPLITEDSALYAGTADDSYTLLPYLDHDPEPAGGALEVEPLVGCALAALHDALATYPWDVHSYTENVAAGLGDEDLRLPPDVLELVLHHRAGMLEVLTPLPCQLAHGDLTPDNLLISRTAGRVAFIDLDHLPLAPRIWDVARYLSRRFRRSAPAAAVHSVTAVVSGYHRAAPLDANEVRAIPAMIATMHVLEASWTRRILDGELDRRLLPEQEAELEPMLEALRRQFRHPGEIDRAVATALE